MRIESSMIGMSSAHLLVEKDAQKETLRAWVGDRRPNFEGQPQEASDETVTLSGTEKHPLPKPVHPGKEPTHEEMRKLLLARDYVKILLIEAMTGKKVRLLPDGTMDLVEPEGCSGEPGEDPSAVSAERGARRRPPTARMGARIRLLRISLREGIRRLRRRGNGPDG